VWYGALCQNACGQPLFGLRDQFLESVEVALFSGYSRPIHRWGEDMVRLSSAGESDSPWHGWRQSPPAGSVGENDSRPLYLFTVPRSHGDDVRGKVLLSPVCLRHPFRYSITST